MKKLSLLIGLIPFIVSSVLYAQEKLTEAQALALIEQYKKREAAAKEKIEEETRKIEELEKKLAVLDEKIASLTAKLSELKAKPKWDIYIVKKGDWLSKLAEYKEVYGHGNYRLWKRIYEANKDLIKNPNLIYPGWELKIPRD